MPARSAVTKPATTHRMLLVAGMLTWAVVGFAHVEDLAREPARWMAPDTLLWGLALLTFGGTFWFQTRVQGRGELPLLVAQTLAALVCLATGESGLDGALLAITAGQVPEILSQRRALTWVGAQVLGMLVVFAVQHPLFQALVQTLLYTGFQGFTFGTSLVMVREAEARRELARVHAELQATQVLLATREREGERLRIARELHDSVGHHLTALSLNLEAAAYTAKDTAAAEHLRRARETARTLLSEVRRTVTELREAPMPLLPSLRALAEGAPGLSVHLDVPGELALESTEAAHSLFRCVQEVLTNTLRHAGARNLWIVIAPTEDGGVRVHARDDGSGAAGVTPGAGLTGMRERFTRLGGRVEWRATTGQGLELEAWLPATQERGVGT
ncbi:sensor histidine kinase [Corallococcus exiguus]|uniref:sensor histidine kinase n=1 Tax=Corallococcus TaxID=83461 RepID=UPI000EC0D2DD|nr:MULTISPECIES: sensor histidine kinase [Corallococcus]NNC14423.1 sensor histidine kinase [Corallococcus exiguus]RKI20109.1 sensor histidine kinase [Corallococcus sp. AB030]RUO92550.1 sensor histidine kinase [Corallococcus sp. AB018]